MAKRKPKSLKPPGRMRAVLAANLRAAMEARFPEHGDKVSELARRSGVSRSSVQRMTAVEPPIGASVDTIEALARALKVPIEDLLRRGSQ